MSFVACLLWWGLSLITIDAARATSALGLSWTKAYLLIIINTLLWYSTSNRRPFHCYTSQFQNSQVFYTTKIIKMNLFFIDLGLLILLSNTCKHVSRYFLPLIIYFHWVIYVIIIQVLNPHKNPKRHDIHKVCVTWWYRDDVRHTPGTVIYCNFWYFLREMFTAISRWNN